MSCKNKSCYGGFVRRFKGRTENEKAIFYDEVCDECKGNWQDNNEIDWSKLLPEIKQTEIDGTDSLPF